MVISSRGKNNYVEYLAVRISSYFLKMIDVIIKSLQYLQSIRYILKTDVAVAFLFKKIITHNMARDDILCICLNL